MVTIMQPHRIAYNLIEYFNKQEENSEPRTTFLLL